MVVTQNSDLLNKTSQLTKLALLYLDAERKIPENWALANFASMPESEAGEKLGYKAPSSGIAFLHYDYRLWQLRPWEPKIGVSGKPIKYLTPRKEYDAFLAKHPEVEAYWTDLAALRARCFTIKSKPYILITEGGFKSITGCIHGIPTVALCGIWMGLTKKDANGNRQLVPALKRLAEAGFNFIIAFDSDTKDKTVNMVRAAELRLAQRLKAYGCDVLSVTGRWQAEDGKGMDNFINNKDRGIEAFRAILMQAIPIGEAHDTGDKKKTKKPPTRREIAARVAEQYGDKWKYDNEQKTWRIWTGKCWEKAEIGAFRSLVKTTIDAKGINYDGIEYVNNVIELLQCDLRQLKWQFWDKSRYINFNNCVFDGAKAKSEPHCPGMGFTSHLPYDYKPLEGNLGDSLEALRVNCPKVHKFLRTAMQGDERKMFKLLAIINALLKYRFFDLQMFVHFVGAPGSGKGKFMRFCQKLVGKGNTIACQLDKLGDGSTKASLMDKQLVVFPDERKPVGIDSILSLTGGDEISYRELYQPAASAHFYGSIMIASNKPIFIGDTTGLERRLCLVQFDNPIATEKRDHSLEAELDGEIPACIAIALSLTDDAVTQAIQGTGTRQIVEFKVKEWEMKVEVNSVAAFFDAELVLDPLATTRVGKIYDAYKYFCEEGGLSKFSIVKFPRLLADIFTDENLPVTRHQGAVAYFGGVRMRENSDTHLTHSQVLERVGEGVAGSLQGVSEGVAPPPDKGLRELRELDHKVLTRSENDENYLQEAEESNLEEDLPPSTPSTPSKVESVRNTTPYTTPFKPPNSSPQLSVSEAARENKRLRVTMLADEMRSILINPNHEQAWEIWSQVKDDPQSRSDFYKALGKEEGRCARVLLFVINFPEGTSLKYVGKKCGTQFDGIELKLYDAQGYGEITCRKPDGSFVNLPIKDVRPL
jgi:putative DNA primase/helicase